MNNSYQNSTIAQIIDAIINQLSFEGESNSDISDILLSILNQTPYEKETDSVIAELFIKLKAKIEGESFEPFEKPYISNIAEIINSILNETEYNDAPNSRIAELLLELKEQIEDDFTELTASGAIASFITNVSKPLVSLVANVKAIQASGTPTPDNPLSISGVSEVEIFHSKKNIFDEKIFEQYGGELKQDGTYYFSTLSPLLNKVLYKNNGYNGRMTLTLLRKTEINSRTFRAKVLFTDGTSSIVGQVDSTGNLDEYNYTTPAGKVVDQIVGDYGSNKETYINLQLEIGTTATSYEPYNCETKTIDLDGTYYGGQVIVDKDGKTKLRVTHKKYTFVGTEIWTQYNNCWYTLQLTDALYASNVYVKCNKYDGLVSTSGATMSNTYPNLSCCLQAQQTYKRFYIKDSNLTESNIQSASVGMEVVYPLAEPIEINLPDIEQFVAYVGANNIWNDSSDSEVTYLYKGQPETANLLSSNNFGGLLGMDTGNDETGIVEDDAETLQIETDNSIME